MLPELPGRWRRDLGRRASFPTWNQVLAASSRSSRRRSRAAASISRASSAFSITRTHVEAEWVTAWAEQLEHLRAVKLTDHDLTKIPPLHAAGLEVFAGDDAILFRYLAAGVDGVMVIAPAIFPVLHVFGVGDEIATTKAILADVAIYTSHEVLPPLTAPGPDRCRLLRAAYALCRSATADRLA
jgi:hypothetical protein